jgi:hypothetical protein
MVGRSGTIYLLHFERPISPLHTTQHYLGWAAQLDDRLAQHQGGRGARLTAVALERGIAWAVVRTWQGGRTLERQLKRRREGPRLCPQCRPTARTERQRPARPAEVELDELVVGPDYIRWSRRADDSFPL